MRTKSVVSSVLSYALFICVAAAPAAEPAPPARPLSELQRDVVNSRFGMFIHFSPTTYLDVRDQLQPDHAPPRQGKDDILGTADDLSPGLFNPTKLDCGQWADAAKSAGMTFATLTAKHHDGFCLWPSKYSTYTVAQGCKRDVVKEFADAFRSRGLKVSIYYSIRDRTERIAGDAAHGGCSPEKIQLIKNQLTELLTNYGPIMSIVFDGWGNSWHESPTFVDIPYAVIHDHIKSIQPNCLIMDHNESRYVTDVLQIEQRAGISLPSGEGWPAVAGNTIQGTWFWRPQYATGTLKSVKWIVEDSLIPLNKRNVVLQLNCAPNRDGLMDDNVVARLAEVGKAWKAPPPLEQIPDSWKDWPVPSSLHLFAGENIAKGKPARHSAGRTVRPAALAVDGDPKTANEIAGANAWWEVDLGKSQPIAGIHIWNRSAGGEGRLSSGVIFVSDKPFESDDPEQTKRQGGVKAIPITEAPGFPTPYAVGASGRYIRIQSTSGKNLNLGEVEVFAGQ